jgi:hypothetical protein
MEPSFLLAANVLAIPAVDDLERIADFIGGKVTAAAVW